MNDIERLTAHRAAETEGERTPAQRAREFSMPDDHARPWTFHRSAYAEGYHVVDAHGLLIASGLSRRDAQIIAGAPELASLAHQFCEDVDAALKRIGL